MPFTFSHPSIILPFNFLKQRLFSITGLVIGSMVPDVEYFIRMKMESVYSHTLPGILWFDLPIAVLIAFLFHNIVRNHLVSHLPIYLSSRAAEYTYFNFNEHWKKKWNVILISIIIGAFTHIVWDGFTHEHRFFVRNIPALAKQIQFKNCHIAIYNLLQHVSSVIGAIVIIIYIDRLPVNNNILITQGTTIKKYKYWLLLIAIAALIISFSLIFRIFSPLPGNIIVACISDILLALITTSLIYEYRN